MVEGSRGGTNDQQGSVPGSRSQSRIIATALRQCSFARWHLMAPPTSDKTQGSHISESPGWPVLPQCTIVHGAGTRRSGGGKV